MALVVMAGPALADGPTVYAQGNAGSAKYIDRGDHIELCDLASDFHSVAVSLKYKTESGKNLSYWRWNWSGKGSCKDLNLSVDDDTGIEYMVCLGDYGKPGGKPADVIESSCGHTGWDEG